MKDTLRIVLAAGVGAVFAVGANNYYQSTNSTKEIVQKEIIDTPINPIIKRVNYHPNIQKGSFVEASKKTMDAVVHIKSKKKGTKSAFGYRNIPDPFRDFFGIPHRQAPSNSDELMPIGSGSGVIISSDGYIVTNNHVIQDADELEITLNNNESFIAEIVGTDPSTDLALLKINQKTLKHLSFANSDEVQVGEWVLAVGNPFRLNSTVTSGIVSAKARNINILKNKNAIESFIQTDAAVNPGNSGGALVNTFGELIGINTAIASNTGSYTGYSFAIPANIVSKVVRDLKDFGIVQRAYIGVSIQNVNATLAKENNLNDATGVFINNVVENGAADEAGMKTGDVIKSVDNQQVKTTAQLLEVIGAKRPGDQISLAIERAGKNQIIQMTLRNKNGETKVVKKSDRSIQELLGVELEQVEKGVKINKIHEGLVAKKTEIQEGFVITKIEGKKMVKPEDIDRVLKGRKGGILIEGYYPGYASKYYYGLGLN